MLVAEDDGPMRDVVVQTLTECGHDVQAVADGASLLVELARHGRFHYRRVDLVIADVRMPHCSGIDVLEAFSAARVRPRFILMTAFPADALIERAAQLGVTVLGKPFTMSQLRDVVTHVLADD